MEALLQYTQDLVARVPVFDRLLDRVDTALPFVRALAACGDVGYACVSDCRSDCGGLVFGYDYANSFAQCEAGILNGWFGDPISGPC